MEFTETTVDGAPALWAEGGFSRLLSRLADEEPGADELREVIERMIAANVGRAPDRWLQRTALNILLGCPARTPGPTPRASLMAPK